MDQEWELGFDEQGLGILAREPEELAEELCDADPKWTSGTPIELGGGVTWKPDLVREDGSALLHIHVAERLRGYATRRFAQAVDAGIEVFVATYLGRLYDAELLEQLTQVDAHVLLLDEHIEQKPERVLAVLADQGIHVPPELRTKLGRHGFDLSSRDGTAWQKGKRFEALVAFLLSQVDGFFVFARNYRTTTEEIDVVIQQRSLDGRVWSVTNAPFLLIEAKNHAVGISQEMFSAFRLKMMTKRESVHIGLMISRTTISADAVQQEAKFASQELTIAFLNGDVLTEWINAPDGTAYLERLISQAMLG
ncbi:MAG TPA: hypothetical protein VNM89_00180 [Solirubrobacterales bacterium]|nr:hypothetical protein [Solirubrobacterales bacterium]